MSLWLQPLWQRMAVAAGPAATLLAIFVFWLHVSYGVSGIALVVNGVLMNPQPRPDREGDEILTVDEPTMIWQQVTLQLLARLGETGAVNLTVVTGNGRVREAQILSELAGRRN